MLKWNVVRKQRRRVSRWVLVAFAGVLIPAVGIVVAGLKLAVESTNHLVIAAIGVEEARRPFLPLALQRVIAKEVLLRREETGFEPALDDPTIVVSFPLVIATIAHSPEEQSETKRTDRHHAMEVARILLRRGIDVDKTDHFGCTAIQLMAMERDLEFFEFLLGLGADPEYRNPDAIAETCRKSANEIMSTARSAPVQQ